jgi:hypothetical protein|tara:strand:+ start:175 stop:708 length:534 start_codon:yes stop_codon:yes gene_type:complete
MASPTEIIPVTGDPATSAVGSETLDLTSVAAITGLAATAALDDEAGPVADVIQSGWGRSTWGSAAWGGNIVDVCVNGLSVDAQVGTVEVGPKVAVTGEELTATLGSELVVVDVAITTTGFGTTSSLGTVATTQLIEISPLGASGTANAGTIKFWDALDVSATPESWTPVDTSAAAES